MTRISEGVNVEAAKRTILAFLRSRPGRGATTATLKRVAQLPLHRDVHYVLDRLHEDGDITWERRRGPVAERVPPHEVRP